MNDDTSSHADTSSEARNAAGDDAPPGFLARLWANWIKPIGAAVLVVCTFRSAVADWNDVPSQSMEPTILVGDRIFVNKLAYDLKVPFTSMRLANWSGPARGDIVVFFSPADGKRMVKRVVGIPGDEIAMRNNQLFINGEAVKYEPISELDTSDLSDPAPWMFANETLGDEPHRMMVQPRKASKKTFGPLVVPDDRYYVMGDNRDNSGDSRYFGFVPRKDIMGRAVGLAFSLDSRGSYSPRWERFFRGLD